MHPPSIDHPLPQTTLEALAGQTITAEGLGGEQALTLFIETLAPACISQDHSIFKHIRNSRRNS